MSLFTDGGTGEHEDVASSEALDDDMFEGVDDKKVSGVSGLLDLLLFHSCFSPI